LSFLTDEIIEHFALSPADVAFLSSNDPHNQLGKALLLKFFQQEYRFPEDISEIPQAIIEYTAQQLDLPYQVIERYEWGGTRMCEHQAEIRELMGFRPATLADQEAWRTWLITEVLPDEYRPSLLAQRLYQHLRREHIEPPTPKQVDRLIASAIGRYEKAFFTRAYDRLSPPVRVRLRHLIHQVADLSREADLEENEETATQHYPLHDLKTGAGEPRIDSKRIFLCVSRRMGLVSSKHARG